MKASEKIAEKMYEPKDYQSKSELAHGLAMTHEQVSDAYTEGTVDGTIDEYAGEQNVEIPREGYEDMFRTKQ